MRLAFVLYKYFPFGGLARDFMRIADICHEKGYTVDVYVMEWHGELLDAFNISIIESKGWSNHSKVASFHRQLKAQLKQNDYDVVIGFNKMSGLDAYYAADPCYVERFEGKGFLAKLNPRYRFYAGVEEAVYGAGSKTVCLMISDVQAALFKKHYATPDERLIMLPPGISLDRRRPENAELRRQALRETLHLAENDIMLLMVGTGFKTKGVNRAIMALANLPDGLKEKAHLIVVGEDDLPTYESMADQQGVLDSVHFMDGRKDVPDFLLAADMLLHPARKENTGTVILEAIVAGLPLLVTDVCGYAKHVKKAQAGVVLGSPFDQQAFNTVLIDMLMSEKQEEWSKNGLIYAEQEDLYSMPEKAVEAIEQVARGKTHAV